MQKLSKPPILAARRIIKASIEWRRCSARLKLARLGDESSLAHQGTSGGATGITSLLNCIKNTLTSQQLDWELCKIVLVQTYGLVSALSEALDQ